MGLEESAGIYPGQQSASSIYLGKKVVGKIIFLLPAARRNLIATAPSSSQPL
jgi:hypothetical protein